MSEKYSIKTPQVVLFYLYVFGALLFQSPPPYSILAFYSINHFLKLIFGSFFFLLFLWSLVMLHVSTIIALDYNVNQIILGQ